MTVVEAAERVLRESAERQPLHYREITRRALALGYLKTKSKTPAILLHTSVSSDIRRREARGDAQRFTRPGRGLIGLAEELPTTLATQIEEHNNSVREQILHQLHEISPAEFEELVANLLTAIGFEDVEVGRYYKDGGIDVRGTLVVADVVRLRIAVQAKRWKTTVPVSIIRKAKGSLSVHEQGLIITTSKFSKIARREAAKADAAPVALMNGEQLTDLLVQYEVGVTKTPHSLLQILEE